MTSFIVHQPFRGPPTRLRFFPRFSKTMPLVSSHVSYFVTLLESGFHAVDFGLQVLDSGFLDSRAYCRFQSLLGFRIPNSLRLNTGYHAKPPRAKIPGIRSGFHEQKFPRIWNLDYLNFLIHVDTRGNW